MTKAHGRTPEEALRSIAAAEGPARDMRTPIGPEGVGDHRAGTFEPAPGPISATDSDDWRGPARLEAVPGLRNAIDGAAGPGAELAGIQQQVAAHMPRNPSTAATTATGVPALQIDARPVSSLPAAPSMPYAAVATRPETALQVPSDIHLGKQSPIVSTVSAVTVPPIRARAERFSDPQLQEAVSLSEMGVTVSIERLELRAAPPARTARQAAPARRISLDEYAARHGRVDT
jgi:hypothetical protein